MMETGIVIIGLGPGGAEMLTRAAWQALEAGEEVYLRTRLHPAVAGLPEGLTLHSFDDLYENGASFESVYARMVEQVLELGRRRVRLVAMDGHTASDTVAVVEDAGIVFTGDLVWYGMFPNFVDAKPSRLSASVEWGNTTWPDARRPASPPCAIWTTRWQAKCSRPTRRRPATTIFGGCSTRRPVASTL